jgi:REP element-mobilizing transposase RayT
MLRGNDGQRIFNDDEERRRFLGLVAEGVVRYGHRIHAYCLMDNHVHFLIQMGETMLSKVMQNISFRYTRWMNRRHHRIGHLFQGRFRAILCDGDAYLLELVRYIHLNPVRAGLVDTPESYPWSGHGAYLGMVSVPWLTCDECLSQFSSDLRVARRSYAAFVLDGVGQGHRHDLYKTHAAGRILGEEHFTERVLNQAKENAGKRVPLDVIVTLVCSVFEIDERALLAPGRKQIFSRVRGVIGLLVQERGDATLTAVAGRFGRDLSSISRNVAIVQKLIKEDQSFRRQYMEAKNHAISQA